MAVKTINTEMLQKMFLAGAANLEAKKEIINELNVFPVPDGDTGTNMTLTIMSAAKEVAAIENPDFVSLSKAISTGSLRGARGNSGVILSQLFRGFTKEVKNAEEINSTVLAKSFERAVETAYKAVMKPKEGTILTVAKGVADKTVELARKTDDLEVIIRGAIEYGDEVLNRTPEMLPILKQAGVVDSGGQGLMQVLKGAFDVFLGKEVDFTVEQPVASPAQTAGSKAEADIRFGYCTEFIIMLEKEYTAQTEKEFKAYLESIGDSIVVVSDEDIVKVHVHTNDPGLAIQKALTYGSLTKMKIDNMREEHREMLEKEELLADKNEEVEAEEVEMKKYAFVSVAMGSGITNVLKDLGVDYVIEGGQTMNPSTQDMMECISKLNAEHIFILPNNKNIIMAANQAAEIADKDVRVIPTKSIPQGITCITMFNPEQDVDSNEASLMEALDMVKTGSVTYAVRDTEMDGIEIKEGNMLGLVEGKIKKVGEDYFEVAKEILESMIDDESELITIFYGKDVDESKIEEFTEKLEEKYEDFDVQCYKGDQPLYYFIMSVE